MRWRISLYHLGDGAIETLPGQDGLNINPMWAPDSRSIAYVSNRTGTENLFLRDLQSGTTYALSTTGVLGASATPDGRFIAFGGQSGNLYVWDAQAAAIVSSRKTGPVDWTLRIGNSS